MIWVSESDFRNRWSLRHVRTFGPLSWISLLFQSKVIEWEFDTWTAEVSTFLIHTIWASGRCAIVNDYYFCRKLEIKVTCGPSTSYVRSSHSLYFKFNKWSEPQFLPIKDDFSTLIQFHYLNYRAEERIPWAIVVDWKEDDLKLEVKGWFDLMYSRGTMQRLVWPNVKGWFSQFGTTSSQRY